MIRKRRKREVTSIHWYFERSKVFIYAIAFTPKTNQKETNKQNNFVLVAVLYLYFSKRNQVHSVKSLA